MMVVRKMQRYLTSAKTRRSNKNKQLILPEMSLAWNMTVWHFYAVKKSYSLPVINSLQTVCLITV